MDGTCLRYLNESDLHKIGVTSLSAKMDVMRQLRGLIGESCSKRKVIT